MARVVAQLERMDIRQLIGYEEQERFVLLVQLQERLLFLLPEQLQPILVSVHIPEATQLVPEKDSKHRTLVPLRHRAVEIMEA